jgi:hypothetical protein
VIACPFFFSCLGGASFSLPVFVPRFAKWGHGRKTNVGQVGNLRGGWLPPPVHREGRGALWAGPIANRPQVTNLPHKISSANRRPLSFS